VPCPALGRWWVPCSGPGRRWAWGSESWSRSGPAGRAPGKQARRGGARKGTRGPETARSRATMAKTRHGERWSRRDGCGRSPWQEALSGGCRVRASRRGSAVPSRCHGPATGRTGPPWRGWAAAPRRREGRPSRGLWPAARSRRRAPRDPAAG
jgi:hypothetical protein